MKDSMRKKWFTLLELIMVIGIIFILILTFKDIFSNTNRDYLYTETCINKVYWEINNFVYSAMTSRGLYIGSTTGTIYPLQYTISIIPNNEIHLRYKDQNNSTWTYKKYDLSTGELIQSFCKSTKYTTKLSGSAFSVTINKASLQDQNFPTFTINDGQEIFSKSIEMDLCYTWVWCKEIANFAADVRTQSIKKKKCVLINEQGSSCLQRDQ